MSKEVRISFRGDKEHDTFIESLCTYRGDKSHIYRNIIKEWVEKRQADERKKKRLDKAKKK